MSPIQRVTTDAGPIPRRGAEIAPLSFAQRRFWFLEHWAPGTPVHHLPIVARLTGTLDVTALAEALRRVIERHEVLRTRFVVIDDEPMQHIEQEAPPMVECLDFSTESDAPTRAMQWIQRDIQRPFDLGRLPLFRATVIKTSADEHVLAIVAHHIIIDAWSVGVLKRELLALYDAERAGTRIELPALPVQYADYAAWQAERVRGGAHERQLAYWRQRLANLQPLTLPTDRPRPPRQTFRGSVVPFRLNERATVMLREASRSAGATLSMSLVTALHALLGRHADQDDVAVGMGVANRHRTEIEDLIGPFVNTFVLRTDLRGAPTCTELLARVRTACLDAYSNQDLPFELLVEALQPVRDPSRTPLFQVLFVFPPSMNVSLSGVQARPRPAHLGVARFDLTVHASEGPADVHGFFEFNTDLFDRWRVQQLAQHYIRLLEAMAAGVDAPVERIDLLSDDERQTWLQAGTGTPVTSIARTIVEAFDARAAEDPDAVASIGGSTQRSYREISVRANQLAHLLRSRGAVRGACVGVAMPRSADLPAVMLGVLKSGAAYLPLDPSHPAARLAEVIADAAPLCVVTTDAIRDALPRDASVLAIDAPATIAQLSLQPVESPRAPDPRDLAYVLYTSGSTGIPKGVMVEHGSLASLASAFQDIVPFARGDRHVAVATAIFDVSLLDLLVPLCYGATTVVADAAEAQDPEAIGALVVRHRATSLQATPSLWALLAEQTRALPGLRALAAGEALPRRLTRALVDAGATVWNLYGPTEMTIYSTTHAVTPADIADGAPSTVPIGKAVPGYSLRVLDRYLAPTPAGLTGELYLAGPGVARGYWRRSELTASRFVADPYGSPGARMYRTGDRVRWRPDGTMDFVGRVDGQVKLRGFRVELGEIEAVLRQHPLVEDAAAALHGDGPDARLFAYVLRRSPNGDGTAAASDEELIQMLLDALRSRLPRHMVPAAMAVLPSWPRSPTGKLDRRALPVPGIAPSVYRPPQLPEQVEVCAIFSAVLGDTRVGLDDDFFALGGHSLLAMRAIARIRRVFGIRLQVRAFFENPTVAKLAALIERTLLEEIEQMPDEVEPPAPALDTALTDPRMQAS